MSTETPVAGTAGRGLDPNLTREVRVAVVLYGGVSLAIYINGVAQELLRMVRASAPGWEQRVASGDERDRPDEVEKLYHELFQRLGSPPRDRTPDAAAGPGRRAAEDEAVHPGDPVRTRLVVDVLSGTSAGGINGIFLAKALALDADMNELRNLWISEGDLGRLLNDRGSVGDLEGRVKLQDPPPSLLNGDRMYYELVQALRGVGDSARRWQRPLVDELDLFVTATDLRGLRLPIRLADDVVHEYRYRSSFHFVLATPHATSDAEAVDEFGPRNDPFLAFAARCTSSFPVAFEPMRLCRIAGIRDGAARFEVDPEGAWSRFYRDYLVDDRGAYRNTPEERRRFAARSFGDGGYLDNKPFGYAIDTLHVRRPGFRVDRKLVYVEPSPEHPELDEEDLEPPDALENLRLALELPRRETIREDLARVSERNRLIQRVQYTVGSVQRDVDLARSPETREAKAPAAPPAEPDPQARRAAHDRRADDWANRGLSDQIREFGASFGGYHRIKVSGVTTDLAGLAARLLDLREGSDHALALRYIVSAWRRRAFAPDPDASRRPENRFLLDFDYAYRLRRIQFVQDRIEEAFAPHGAAGPALLGQAGLALPEAEPFLRGAHHALSEAFVALRVAGRRMRRRDAGNPLVARIGEIGIDMAELGRVTEANGEQERRRRAESLIGLAPEHPDEPRYARLLAAFGALRDQLEAAFRAASESCRRALEPAAGAADGDSADRRLRMALWRYYDEFDRYDAVLFPLLYGTGVGETDPVDVWRVSPEDARGLIPERGPSGVRQIAKLAGTRLGHFGAFLEADWRRSDILWGRLDAAERFIDMLCAGDPTPAGDVAPVGISDDARAGLVLRVQSRIIEQELRELGPECARRVFLEAFFHVPDKEKARDLLAKMLDRLGPRLAETAVGAWLRREELQTDLDRLFDGRRSLEPRKQVRYLARGTTVFGRMLDGFAGRFALVQRVAFVVTSVGRAIWGLVEIAIPRSFWAIVAHYWINVLYALEALVLALALLARSAGGALAEQASGIGGLAFVAFALTLLVDVSRRLMWAYVTHRRWWQAIGLLFALAAAALLVLGFMDAKARIEALIH